MVIFPSAARTQPNSPHNADFTMPQGYRGLLLRLDITASGGTTPTLDVKLQYYNEATDEYEDLRGMAVANAAAFAQKTGAGEDDLVLYPGLTEAANRTLGAPVPRNLRAVATTGADADETFTFSLVGIPLT
jgi:hypothetical protein